MGLREWPRSLGFPSAGFQLPLPAAQGGFRTPPNSQDFGGHKGYLYSQKKGIRKKRLDLELQERGLKSSRSAQSISSGFGAYRKAGTNEAFLLPPEQPLCAKEATLQPLLQDILHALPALIQTATTPSDPAKTAQIPLYCGRTKIFMTDSMVNWLGGELQVQL